MGRLLPLEENWGHLSTEEEQHKVISNNKGLTAVKSGNCQFSSAHALSRWLPLSGKAKAAPRPPPPHRSLQNDIAKHTP